MNAPIPTPIYRILHIDNLPIILSRKALHAPNFVPSDGLTYRTIHNVDIQRCRHTRVIPCGPRGVIHDYVSFYFGPRSPMLLQLHTGQVVGYTETQRPIIYLVSTAQAIVASGTSFVLSDGHGIAAYTSWYDSLNDLDKVDWNMVNARYWKGSEDDPDCQRRKQAEFLVYGQCALSLITEIGVIDASMIDRVQTIMNANPNSLSLPVRIHKDWYY